MKGRRSVPTRRQVHNMLTPPRVRGGRARRVAYRAARATELCSVECPACRRPVPAGERAWPCRFVPNRRGPQQGCAHDRGGISTAQLRVLVEAAVKVEVAYEQSVLAAIENDWRYDSDEEEDTA